MWPLNSGWKIGARASVNTAFSPFYKHGFSVKGNRPFVLGPVRQDVVHPSIAGLGPNMVWEARRESQRAYPSPPAALRLAQDRAFHLELGRR